jgi:ectoine hydroxylase-related dioxygenase (phytanoyl-CoA dioxygenase family)
MRKQAERLLENFDITKHPMTKFSTEEKTHINDRYFLDSSDNISFFLEEKAVDADGKLTVPKERAVNKIGHALHKLDPVFKKMSSKREISDLLRSLQYKDPIMLQSMLIFKQPFVGGKVMPHQDSTFLYTDPPSALGFWFPLETATEENGCLWFIPGSHKTHPISRRLVRNPDYFERDTDLKTPQSGIDSTVPTVKIRYEPGVIEEKFDDNAFIKAEVPAGAAVLLHGSVVHKSNENTSAKSRFVYAFHCVETGDGVKYSPENWLQMPAGVHFTKVYQNNCA